MPRFIRRDNRDVSREDLPTPEITSPIRRRISVPVIERSDIVSSDGVVIGHRDVNSGEVFYPNSGDLHIGYFPEAVEDVVRRKGNCPRDDARSMADKLPYIRWPLGWMVKAVPPILGACVTYRITSEKLWEHEDKFVVVSFISRRGAWDVMFYKYDSGMNVVVSCDMGDIDSLFSRIGEGLKSLKKGVLFGM